MSNTISLYQKNAQTIYCDVTSSLTIANYSYYLNVKKNITDTSASLALTGSLSGSTTLQFELNNESSSMATGHYTYDIVMESGSNYYTVVQNDWNVLDSVLY